MIGKIVTHYKILERLGGGGMGLVYKAQDLTLDRSVALKFLPPVFSMNEDLKLKIIQEAKIAATLEHPNICNIHEVGETEDGQIFIVMAYYEGETLKKVIQNNSLNRDNLESIILQIAKGLQQAHDNEIIHRDIKPANIFLTNKNEIKILDFGVAKVQGDFSAMDAENLKGTIAYMSPEQISGEEVDQRTDIWAFGVLLYELLTGQKPFKSEYEQTALYSIMNDDVSFSDLDLDEHLLYLKKVVSKCLEKNKADRFQSMKEIVELIQQNSIIQTKSKSNRFYNSTSFKLFSTTIFILIGILLIINFRGYLGWSSGENIKKRIAVFPFDYNIDGEDSIDLPILLQSILVKNLITFKEYGVIDPNSLNEFMNKTEDKYVSHHNLSFYSSLGDLNISYFIDGSVTKNENDFTIKTNIIDLKTHEVSFNYENKYSDEKNFLQATEDISSQIINFFQVKIHPLSKEKDLTPWVNAECDNMLALKSFMQASQIIYRQEPGAEKYLRQALEYDSCYISPRIWLISHLVAVGNYEEAKKHMKVLDRLESKANPFEQAMINYTRAYINDDLSKQIQYLSVALEYSPNNNILLYSLARLYYLIGDYQKSADTIRNTISMNWSFSPAYSLGGYAYYRLKNMIQQKKFLNKL
ncbi:MAG: protein kinase [Ignavibacteriales bacterium]|nr:protein kinase [Ignavibacteriales bacterium]